MVRGFVFRCFLFISLAWLVAIQGGLEISRVQAASPSLTLPSAVTVPFGAPLHIPITASDTDGDALSIEISVSDPTAVESFVPSSNRSLELNVTNFGTMTFELFESRAPSTTGRIIELTEAGFYDDVIFHRVIDGFVIQGGDPTGTGRGGSDLGDFDDEFHVDLLHTGPGVLAMAKADDDTNDSQFYITETATPFLDFNHSVFGHLTSGEDVRDAISNASVDFRDSPSEPIVIESARIIDDQQNGVLMLKALQLPASPVDVMVTVNDGQDSVSQSIQVSVVEDFHNHQPFLRSFPETLETGLNDELTFQFEAVDLEGDSILFESFAENELVQHEIGDDGLLRMRPPEDFLGELRMAVRVSPNRIGSRDSDLQFYSINVVPEPSSALGMVLGLGLWFLRCRQIHVG